jgi:uroporphyrinogen III methyltransferase/synthase
VYLVGAGPGDPGLITVRGRELLGRADVVVYDYLASARLLEHAPALAERIYVGKQAAAHTLSQDEINRLLVERAQAGKTVVRLKGGDPFIFGRGGEEALELVAAGIAFEIVPGITSGIAALAYAGIPATHRRVATCLGLVTGHETPDKGEPELDWASLAAWKGTLVFYMGVANLPYISRKLIENGRAADTPAAVIRWGTTPRQEVLAGTLDTLPELVQRANFKPPAVIVVGEVVSLREKLQWLEKRPLLGRGIVVTRARAQASEFTAMLDELGADVIELPAIRIVPAGDLEPLRQAVANVRRYDWIVFTSVNGAEAFFAMLASAKLDARALAGRKIAAIGPATAGRLAELGVRADLQPEKFSTAHVVEALAGADNLSGKRVLCPRADIAPPELIDGLKRLGAAVDEVTAYSTIADNANAQEVIDRLSAGKIDWITFTSSSTVENFFAAVKPDLVRASAARLASIGPATSDTIRRLGLTVAIEAESYTLAGLTQAIVQATTGGQ